jgi:hypothetical protein
MQIHTGAVAGIYTTHCHCCCCSTPLKCAAQLLHPLVPFVVLATDMLVPSIFHHLCQ